MPEKWRLIVHDPMSGDINMGVDTALLHSANNGETGPVLRIYGWREPTLSIGYAQNTDSINMDALDECNVKLVRRPTGGRAILHDDEFTYSIAIPVTSRLYGSLSEIYHLAGDAILNTLKKLGVPVDSPPRKYVSSKNNPLCFSSGTKFETLVSGKKVTGSAQRRLKNAALQHGSILLSHNTGLCMKLFQFASHIDKEKISSSFGAINDGRKEPIMLEQLGRAFISSFEEVNNAICAPSELSRSEHKYLHRIMSDTPLPH